MSYRVLVTGSRTWADHSAICGQLDDLLREHGRITVVHGACGQGADRTAHEWLTRKNRVSELGAADEEAHPADWRQYGKRAGMIRNGEMIALGADVCLAFIQDDSPGASHCAALAEKAAIPVRRFTA